MYPCNHHMPSDMIPMDPVSDRTRVSEPWVGLTCLCKCSQDNIILPIPIIYMH